MRDMSGNLSLAQVSQVNGLTPVLWVRSWMWWGGWCLILNTSRRCLYCSCEIEATLERLKKLERDLSSKEQELKERERRLKMWERKLIEQSNTPVSSSGAHCTPHHPHPQHNPHTLSSPWTWTAPQLSITFTVLVHVFLSTLSQGEAKRPRSVWNEGKI